VRVGPHYDLWFDFFRPADRPGHASGDNFVDASCGIATLDVRGPSVSGAVMLTRHGNSAIWLDSRNSEIITANIVVRIVLLDLTVPRPSRQSPRFSTPPLTKQKSRNAGQA